MFLLDLSAGVSPELLYAALFHITGHASVLIPELFLAINKQCTLPFIDKLVSYYKQPQERQEIPALKQALSAYSPLNYRNIFTAAEACLPAIHEFVNSETLKNLDPWNLFIYICLILLQNNKKREFLVSTPRIGMTSQAEVFEVFKGKRIITSVHAREVSPLCAMFLNTFFTRFMEECNMEINELTLITDPLYPSCTAKLFGYNANAGQIHGDSIIVIETNIDDSTPEIIAWSLQQILEKGALDFSIIPVTMKKGRPGFLVQVLCTAENCKTIEELLLTTTSTFGLRKYKTERRCLRRELKKFHSSYGEIHVKYGFLDDKCIKAVPEIEDVIALSNTTKIPLIHLYQQISNEATRQNENIQ